MGLDRQFLFNWKVTLFALLCLCLFVNLGFWQLDRGAQKVDLIATMAARAAQPPLTLSEITDANPGGLPVKLVGRFDPEVVLLLDNRVLDGAVGFEVHHLFRQNNGNTVLINRGFVQMGRTRDDPVAIKPVPGEETSLKGHIYQPLGEQYRLHNEPEEISSFPAIVQQIDIVQLENTLDLTVYPYVVRLGLDQTGALPRFWPETNMTSEKHYGYAFQWFMMAIAVTMAWGFFSFRKKQESEI